jgi:hypothetical protein
VRESVLPRRRERLGQSALTLEELPIAVHQRNERHRDVEHGRRRPRQPVECLLGRGVEKRRPSQRVEAGLVMYDVDELVVQVEALQDPKSGASSSQGAREPDRAMAPESSVICSTAREILEGAYDHRSPAGHQVRHRHEHTPAGPQMWPERFFVSFSCPDRSP